MFCVRSLTPTPVFSYHGINAGLPLMMSSPHFLYADHVYRDNVTGMHPNFEHHATFVDIEPVSKVISFVYVVSPCFPVP